MGSSNFFSDKMGFTTSKYDHPDDWIIVAMVLFDFGFQLQKSRYNICRIGGNDERELALKYLKSAR